MKIKGLHPEHRFRRLIEDIYTTHRSGYIVRNSILYVFLFIPITLIIHYSIRNYRYFSIDLSNIVLSSLILPIIIMLSFIIVSIFMIIKYVNTYQIYSLEIKDVWLKRLFKYNWITQITDIKLVDRSRNGVFASNRFFGMSYTSSNPLTSTQISKFMDFYKNPQLLNNLSQKLFVINPNQDKSTIENWISESNSIALYNVLLIRISLFILFVFIVYTCKLQLIYFFFFMLGVIHMYYISKSIARTCNATVLRAILCALYLRDPDHEITDQRVLGIPSYIDYKSLVQKVDSYMIESPK